MAYSCKQVCSLLMVILDVIFLVGCPITMIAFGAAVGKPYHATRHFTATTCTVRKVVRAGQIACHCDKSPGCKSHYPCVEIIVQYLKPNSQPVLNATLFDDAHNFISYGYINVANDRKAIKCSTYSCEGSVVQDAHNVAAFMGEYGRPGQSYTCFYNQENENQVLLNKLSMTLLAFGLLFPLLCFIAALLLFFFLYHRILSRRGEKRWCFGRTYDIEPNELSPPVPVMTIAGSEPTFSVVS